MKKNMKYFIVLLVLLFLSISVVNASDNTTDLTSHTLEKTTTQNMEKVATSTQEEIQKENKNINTTNEKQINKKSTTKNTKTEPTEVDIGNYDDLYNNLTSSDSDDVTINIQSNITLGGSTTVASAIKTLTINGNDFTINGNGQYQFLNIPSGTTVTLNNITITNWCDKQFSFPL